FFGVICGSSFLITTDNVKLDYLGHSCDFGNDIQDWWLEIESGESFSYTIPLNRAYEFLPGKHQYQIGSLEYPIITKEWFSEKNMYNKMFSIFNWRSSCSMKTDYPLVLKRRFLCPRYEVDKNNLRRVLNNFGFNGNSSNYYFEIRTNQVSILIDANKNISYYQFTENKLKGHKKIIMKK
ncbi:TPA: transposase, partial [Citrobacter freundii]|nr:transposase [Citrobacter freundii]